MIHDGGQDSENGKETVANLEKDKKHLHHFVKKLINLEHKILIFLDTPRMSLFEALMPLLSHDSYESEYKYVDTNGPIKTYKNLLRGWPCFIFAQAIDYSEYKRFPELQRRFIITNPTMDSKKKYEEAIHLIVQKHCLPDFMYQKLVVSDDEKRKAKEIIAYLTDKITKVCDNLKPGKNSTFVPFGDAVESGLTKEQTSDMTIAKRFSSFLQLLPMINVTKRPSIIMPATSTEEKHTIPLATFEDLKEATFLMHYSNGVRPYVLQWYYDVFLPCYNAQVAPYSKIKKVGKENVEVSEPRIAVITTQLIETTKQEKNKSYTSKYLHEQFIYPLTNQGYLDSMESETDRRGKIYFPANEDDKNIVFMPYSENRAYLIEDSKINIRDITTFPDKQYIKSKIEAVIKYSSEIGVDAYIQDSDEKEVSIDQLDEFVDRYYPNPESYFEYFSNKNTTETVGTGS